MGFFGLFLYKEAQGYSFEFFDSQREDNLLSREKRVNLHLNGGGTGE